MGSSSPNFGMNIENIWNHHPDTHQQNHSTYIILSHPCWWLSFPAGFTSWKGHPPKRWVQNPPDETEPVPSSIPSMGLIYIYIYLRIHEYLISIFSMVIVIVGKYFPPFPMDGFVIQPIWTRLHVVRETIIYEATGTEVDHLHLKHQSVDGSNREPTLPETKNIASWGFPKIGVPPNHPFLIGISIINHPFWGIPIFGNTQLVVEPTHLKNIVSSNWETSPSKGKSINHIWKHHKKKTSEFGPLKSALLETCDLWHSPFFLKTFMWFLGSQRRDDPEFVIGR